jgi:uncharacterized DUF497 family protein
LRTGYIRIRFDFDRAKSREVKRKYDVSLKEAQEIFDEVYLADQKNRRSGTVDYFALPLAVTHGLSGKAA